MTEAPAPPPGDGEAFAGIAPARPRLMATPSAMARTEGLLRHNPTLRQWRDQVAKQADLMLTLPVLAPDWVHDARETGAAPLPLVRPPPAAEAPATALDIARLFCLRIQTLGIVWLLGGDTRYRDRAKAELLAVCAFPDWTGDEFLVTAETAFGAAIGYDWLYDALSEGERAQVIRAILDKAIQPGLDQFAATPPAFWIATATNWNLVCNAALMIAALSIAGSDPRAARLFALCRASVAAGFAEYRPDGGWAEGPGYWHYATQYAIYLLDCLATALGTDLGFDAAPGLAKTGFFRLHAAGPSGKLFNFADSAEQHSGGYWLFWLARRYRHPVDASIERHRGRVHPMDLLWFHDSGRGPGRLAKAKRFREVDVAMLRGDWRDRNATYIGVKAGANDARSHSHHDLGSFVLDAAGVRWATDLGPDDYGLPGYFKPEMRCRYYRTSTLGHNTIVIDGQCQPPTARAAIVRKSFRPNLSFVAIDLSNAYPSTASAWRGVALIDGRHVLVVDEIVPKECLASIDWQMHTVAEAQLRGAAAVLTQPPAENGEPARLYLGALDPIGGTWAMMSAAPSGASGQSPNTGIGKLVLRLDQVTQAVRLAILLSPDATACTSLELPSPLRQPVPEWGRPAGRATAGTPRSTCPS